VPVENSAPLCATIMTAQAVKKVVSRKDAFTLCRALCNFTFVKFLSVYAGSSPACHPNVLRNVKTIAPHIAGRVFSTNIVIPIESATLMRMPTLSGSLLIWVGSKVLAAGLATDARELKRLDEGNDASDGKSDACGFRHGSVV
jgi:hypothetical protein